MPANEGIKKAGSELGDIAMSGIEDMLKDYQSGEDYVLVSEFTQIVVGAEKSVEF